VEGSIIGARVRLGERNVLRKTRLWPDVVLGDSAMVVDD
jgi:hypothetical protein